MKRSGNRRISETPHGNIRRIILFCLFVSPAVPGCEEDVPPPPPREKPATVEPPIDIKHTLHFRADRTVAVPNMVLVVQEDPEGLSVSLTASRPSLDGATAIFGEYLQDVRLANLVDAEIRMISGRMFIAAGDMVQTMTAIYKPRDIVMRITSLKEGEAQGTIKGECYRFAAPATAMTRPTEIKVDATFSAKLIIR